jgi:hypothetical protein
MAQPTGRTLKAAWLADAVAKFDQKKAGDKDVPAKKPAAKKATVKTMKQSPAARPTIATEKKTLKPKRKSA